MKREYGKVTSGFWSGNTGQALRGQMEGQIVAFYLITCQHANMIGLYYLPLVYLMHDTGLSQDGASKGLAKCVEIGFCKYDPSSGFVWIINMAGFQVGEGLAEADKRCKGVQNQYDQLGSNPFLGEFFDMYRTAFHMTSRRPQRGPVAFQDEAPSKPLRRTS